MLCWNRGVEIPKKQLDHSEFIYVPENWAEVIKKPDWYFVITQEFRELLEKAKKESDEKEEQVKQEVYRFFEQRMEAGDVALGKNGPDWDAERKPIDTVVIHHTSESPGLSWQKLSAMHLLRLYVPYYANPSETKAHIKGQPIFSHHFKDKHPVFYAYHWLVRENGENERLLNDNEIGWQAGNWDINCRSIAICLDNDLEDTVPSDSAISQVADLVRAQYPNIDPSRIFGHGEINPKSVCPGKPFLEGWKPKLIEQIKGR